MMDPQTLQLAGFVSQATFALTLTLLAWSDRRSRGMVWLAGACGLQLFGNASRPIWVTSMRSLNDAAGSCLLVLLFFFVYMGLRWFVVRRKLRSIGGPLSVSLAMVAVLAIEPLSPDAALSIARVTVLVLMAKTVLMLLTTRFRGLRTTSRTCAAFLMFLASVVAFRLPIDLHFLHVSAVVENSARAATLISVSLVVFSFVGMFVAESKRRLHDETRLDSLTGLRNRRAMEEIALHEVLVAARTQRPLSLLMMDIDHFKKLNDTWGHGLGDRCLRAIGGVLLTVTGADDRVIRMGGEEFAVILPNHDLESAARIGERLRATVEGLRLAENDDVASFTVSIGVGPWVATEPAWSEMLRRADVALYRAKREGRNRVVIYTPPTPASTPEKHEGRSTWRSSTTHRIARQPERAESQKIPAEA
jgi:diguanylate cyclase (GGDEF)-like protein